MTDLHGVIVRFPDDEDRYFIVQAKDETKVRRMVMEKVDADLCSIQIVSPYVIFAQFDGCIEALS